MKLIEINTARWPWLHWSSEPVGKAKMIGGIALASSIISGSTFNAFAKSLSVALSPIALLFVSELLTAFFVLFSFGSLPTIRRLLRVSRRHVLPLFAMGCLSGVLAPLLWFSGLHYTTAVNAGLFGKAEILCLLLLAHFVIGERLERSHLLALLSILIGIVIISLRGFTAGLSLQLGDMLIIFSAICYGCGSIVFRKFLSHAVDPHIALLVRSMTAIGSFFLLSPFLPQQPFIQEIGTLPLTLLPALIGFGFISRFLNSVCFYQAIDRLPVTTISLVGTLDIIGSTLFSRWFLGETLLPYHIIGGVFIVLGNLLLSMRTTSPATHEEMAIHLKQHHQHRT